MSIYDSKIWISDLDEVISSLPELNELEGKSILITGCSGLICSAVADILIRRNVTHDAKIKVLAAGRNQEKVYTRFGPYVKEPWFEYVQYDAALTEPVLNAQCDYIIHGASNASPNKVAKEPVETMMSNFIGTKLLLDLAKMNGAERFLLISSSEVYGKKGCDRPNRIDEYGGIDILNPRNAYSIGKCAAETLCASYYQEYGVDSVIIRPGHIYGPTALESDSRVSSAWAYAVARGEDIVMKSDGSQLRSYCYCLDCASAILKVLMKGAPMSAYNVSDQDVVLSIREMAELLTCEGGVKLKMELPTDAERKIFNPMNNSSLDGSELLSLGWNCLFDAKRGFIHTVKILKEIAST